MSRCVAGALALIITMAGVSDVSSSSDPAIAQSSENVQTSAQSQTTETTDETVAFTVAGFKASQGASSSVVTGATSQGAQTTTTAASTTAASTTTASKAETAKATTTTKSASSANKGSSNVYKPAVTTAPGPVQTDSTTTTPAQIPSDPDATLAKPVIEQEKTYDTDYTHPWNHQTNQITVHWNAVAGAKTYMLFVKNGQYSTWTNVATTADTKFTVTGLKRETVYAFAVKAVGEEDAVSDLSTPVQIKTARMDYSAAGWQAMCRIVYHEVGGAAGSFWDKPIVYVADCVTNQYVCAKYTKKGVWAKYYSRYSNIESIIYTSGGFASSSVLAARGATYARVSQRVKVAVWGATYGVTALKNIANDYNIFYWSSTGSAVKSSKLGYSFKTPWGNYVNIWRQYWG